MEILERFVPTYGNYGGPGYSGGGRGEGANFTAPPVDDLDDLFRDHDIAYQNARGTDDIDEADRELVAGISSLPERNSYAHAARLAFLLKRSWWLANNFPRRAQIELELLKAGIESNPGPMKRQRTRPVGRGRVTQQAMKMVESSLSRARISKPARQRVGQGSVSRQLAPLAVGVSRSTYFNISSSNRYKGGITIRAQDRISTISTPGGALSDGIILGFFDVNPQSGFVNTRASAIAAAFDKFHYKWIRLHWAPSKSASTDGQIVLAWEKDVSDHYVSGQEATLTRLMACQGAAQGSVWTQMTAYAEDSSPTVPYYVSRDTAGSDVVDPRLYSQGCVYIAGTSNLPPDATPVALGSLWIEYELELYESSFDPDSGTSKCISTSNTAPATTDAWAEIVVRAAADATGGHAGKHKMVVLPNGKTGYILTRGKYDLHQSHTVCAAAANPFLAPTIVDRKWIDPRRPASTITNRANSTTVAGAGHIRRDRLDIKAEEAWVYGNITAGNALGSGAQVYITQNVAETF